MIAPIKKISVVDQAIERIYELIRTNQLQIGDRLPGERELSEALEISRSSLREAIRVLDIMGIVSVEPGNGMILDTPKLNTTVLGSIRYLLMQDKQRLSELIDVRRLLEGECAGLAARNATDEDIEELWRLLLELEKHHSERKYAIDKELALHDRIALASQNTIFIEMLLSIKGLLIESRESTVPQMGVTERTIESQRNIIQAITDRDSDRAKAYMLEHLTNVYTRDSIN